MATPLGHVTGGLSSQTEEKRLALLAGWGGLLPLLGVQFSAVKQFALNLSFSPMPWHLHDSEWGPYVAQDPEGSQVPQSPMGSLCNPGTPRVHRHLSHLQGPYVTQEPPRVHRCLSHPRGPLVT